MTNEIAGQQFYDWPFFISSEDKLKGVTTTHEEADRMYDWRNNPMAALPNWISVAVIKNGGTA